MSTPLISVVIPVYKSAESLEELGHRLTTSLSSITSDFEVILVNDGSPDNSWSIISKLAKNDKRFIGIRLSRNFGQHAAINAGLEKCIGEWIVVMDCDLQDKPEEIINLYNKALDGYQQVVAVRHNRQDSLMKKSSARLYVKCLSYMSGRNINPYVGNFGIYHRQVIDAITSFTEQGRNFGLMALWVGFERYELEVEHVARPYGKSSYSLKDLVRLGLLGIVSHSDKPLRLTVKTGAYLAIASLVGATWIVLRQLLWGHSPIGWSSVMVAIFFTTGVLLGFIGVTGLYVSQIFDEVKKRPLYLLWENTQTGEN